MKPCQKKQKKKKKKKKNKHTIALQEIKHRGVVKRPIYIAVDIRPAA